MEKLDKLIAEHEELLTETWAQANEISGFDATKFTKKEVAEITQSFLELELELSLRRLFLCELKSLRNERI